MADLDVPDLDAFIAAARARSVATVIVAWRDEWSQAPDEAKVDYRRVRRSVLLAYAKGELVRATLDGDAADRQALATALGAAGFAVELRCRNLGMSDRAG